MHYGYLQAGLALYWRQLSVSVGYSLCKWKQKHNGLCNLQKDHQRMYTGTNMVI